MHPHFHILLYFLLISKTLNKQIEIKCPQHCSCDIFKNLKRATCSHRTLANIESNFPEQTEILDLSHNQINQLPNDVFVKEKLTSLKLLNISYNQVNKIEIYSFRGLTNLKTLDLSYNGIQYILESWFLSMVSLEELYLKHNSFSIMDSGAVFNSKSLKKLDLSDCGISFISAETLSKLENLELLDLSRNYLIQLKLDTIKSLSNLNTLNLNNTQLRCDGHFQELSSFCTTKGIRFIHPCGTSKILPNEKFQRMVNTAPPVEEKNSWIYDDEQDVKNDNKTEIIETCNNTRVDKSLLQEIVDLSPVLSITIPFIYGIAVGVLIAYILHVCTDKNKENLNESTYLSFDDGDTHLQRRNRLHRISARFSRSFSTEDRQNLPLREWNISESTPVLFRKNQVRL
ncbi:hypothetical protein Zmor_002684 [Zophobas morio]|uniref:SWIM-type domain-containing protein n=1 Tax=Zophobas morio TaxID=2755281 RepID=A0AA38HLK1_9CUCU|nr:hypothetical protein Zmor_002684 [Zophobas morio]